jgi:hypothetical protein
MGGRMNARNYLYRWMREKGLTEDKLLGFSEASDFAEDFHRNEKKIEYLQENLIIGTKIKLGKEYSIHSGMEEGEVIELVEGYFEYDNGLYTESQSAPSIWSELDKEFDSIFHLFGNDFEYFMDCKIIKE